MKYQINSTFEETVENLIADASLDMISENMARLSIEEHICEAEADAFDDGVSQQQKLTEEAENKIDQTREYLIEVKNSIDNEGERPSVEEFSKYLEVIRKLLAED